MPSLHVEHAVHVRSVVGVQTPVRKLGPGHDVLQNMHSLPATLWNEPSLHGVHERSEERVGFTEVICPRGHCEMVWHTVLDVYVAKMEMNWETLHEATASHTASLVCVAATD